MHRQLHGWKTCGVGSSWWVMLYLEVASKIHSGPILASVLHIFINDLKEATEATVIKLTRGAKLGQCWGEQSVY